MTTLTLPRAILFDMDGTLTRPMLDFAAIKAEMGIGHEPILEAMASMTAAQRQRAQCILERHEHLAATESTLNDGCTELLNWLDCRDVGTALITRNSRRSASEIVRRHALAIDVLVTRDDGAFKPDPRPLHTACQRLRVPIGCAWMVGDGQYDVEAGLAAGAVTVWISHGRSRPFDAVPSLEQRDLIELLAVLRSCHPRPDE
jgi:HAD superfamily hydrolase (TIGR01509 family)